MKPSCFSFEISSSDLCFVSGMRSVEKIPVNINRAKISILQNQIKLLNMERKSCCSHVLHELVCATNVNKLSKADLGNDSSELASGSRDTVTC